MAILPLLIQLVSGAAGGNIAGKLLKNLSLGTGLNSIVGLLGGGLGGMILKMLGISGAVAAGGEAAAGADVAEAVGGALGGLDLGSILQSVGGGGVGGGALLTIIGMIKKMMAGNGPSAD